MTLDADTVKTIFTVLIIGQIVSTVAVCYVCHLAVTGRGWWKEQPHEDERARIHRVGER